ncbi:MULTISPECIES: hypothetical protein [Mycobacterium]|uniref:Uncharacterized protein n=1 Tax=Mycobacterium intracellulare subsp. chimaera TaxID=222805 RepID=A0A220XTZ8_MYCIT|nr:MULTISPECIES: hypothetical protein [Mycobacterium]AFJ35156.1 hypothetical protein W7S_10925 [Mycobacterium sp. MOTT36Y]AGP63645.1 hypothetical protein OEM_21100 [Mycobacterium intracellulare subsp. yongonense 05-1390]ARR77754.1 hypothetical protein MOTT12_02090 [Mycobacterium intracellulare subsp. yongonense]ARR82871.1 hypothetical protein MOTT27_02050 [Mycobacterium intracellulare subsp. yongonense]ASL14961.1 hypothetical protein MYCOZU2_02555 [Mycobacterium intracellulare subsp. chimaera]
MRSTFRCAFFDEWTPAVLICQELQIFEGVCEHRSLKGFVRLIAKWREVCTNEMPMQPQTFLDLTALAAR